MPIADVQLNGNYIMHPYYQHCNSVRLFSKSIKLCMLMLFGYYTRYLTGYKSSTRFMFVQGSSACGLHMATIILAGYI